MDKKEKRFTQDDLEKLDLIIVPQCFDCKNNIGKNKCNIYGEKPIKYLKNKEVCPNYKDGD